MCVSLEIVGGRELKLLGQRGVLGGSPSSSFPSAPVSLRLELQIHFLSPHPLGPLQPAG